MSGRKPTKLVFGRRLRDARKTRGLPQDVLGVLAGLDESSSSARISRYESGIHEPPFQFAQALAKVLSVSPAYFYCPDDKLAEIILTYSRLPKGKQESLYREVMTFRGQDGDAS